MNLTLFQIENELMQLIDLREEVAGGGNTPEELAAIDAQIAEYVKGELSKVDSIASLLREFQKRADVAGEEAARLKGRADMWQRRHDRLEEIAITAMQVAGKTKLEGQTSTLAIRKNPPSVNIRQAEFVPEQYQRAVVTMSLHLLRSICRDLSEVECREIYKTVTEPVKSEIAQALKRGEAIPGCELVTDKVRLEVK